MVIERGGLRAAIFFGLKAAPLVRDAVLLCREWTFLLQLGDNRAGRKSPLWGKPDIRGIYGHVAFVLQLDMYGLLVNQNDIRLRVCDVYEAADADYAEDDGFEALLRPKGA